MSFAHGGNPASTARALESWKTDREFREWFGETLAAAPYAAFRFETPPVDRTRLQQPFECVLLDSPELEAEADPSPFADHFRTASSPWVVEFANLGGDAVLIVPLPTRSPEMYGHLARFVRQAPSEQRHALWQQVGDVLERRVNSRAAPVWLSTAGAGVPWLHVRLDDRPKYYGHGPYRRA